MNRSTTKKSVSHAKTKKTKTSFLRLKRLPYLASLSLGIITLLVGGVIFNYSFNENPNANAQMPIQTFQTTYSGYNTSTSWISSYNMEKRCSKTQTIYGAKPAAAGIYPTVIYLHGTTADTNKNKEGQRFVEKAAGQGFNAYAVTYTSSGSLNEKGLQRHAYCMFDQNHGTKDAVSSICTTAGATCEYGLLLSGFSQGAAIGAIAKNYNSKVEALWAIGLSAYIYPSKKVLPDALAAPLGTRALTNDKIAINMGEASNLSTRKPIKEDLPSLKQLTGTDCGTAYDCIQPNGSGYYIVSNSEIKDKVADHCYWQMVNKWSTGMSCTTAPTDFEPGFQPPATTKWSMITNLNWLKSQL